MNKNIILLALFMIMTIDSSFWLISKTTGTSRIVLTAIVIIILLIFSVARINKKNTIFCILLCTCAIASGALFGNLKQTMIFMTCLVAGYLFTCFVDRNRMEHLYIDIIYFIACFSLITWGINLSFPKLITIFPFIINREGISFYNAFFSVLNDNTYVCRNYGPFWEPGAFSIFLNIGIYLMLFKEQNFNYKKIFVLTATILSTLSTLGIICNIILFIAFYPESLKKMNIKIRILFWIVIIIGLGYCIFINDRLIFHVFEKLKFSDINTANASTKVRLLALIEPMKEIIKSPLYGIGMADFLILQEEKCHNMATFTQINWICVYGIPFGICLVYGEIRYFMLKKGGTMTTFLLILFSILLFSTENFLMITFIYTLVFYGLKPRTE